MSSSLMMIDGAANIVMYAWHMTYHINTEQSMYHSPWLVIGHVLLTTSGGCEISEVK